MKKTKSRILSLLLTAAMVFSMLPTAAFATETADPTPEPGVEDTIPMTPLTPAEPVPAEEPVALADTTTVYVKADGNGDGAFATPFGTLAAAYAAVATDGEIRVLSDLNVAAATTFDAVKTVTIQSYDDATGQIMQTGTNVHTITRGTVNSVLLNITAGNVTLKNITLKGGGKEEQSTENFIIVYGAALTLGSGGTIRDAGMAQSKQSGIIYIHTPRETNTTVHSSFTMEEGSLVDSVTAGSGCIRLFGKQATFTMNGGAVKNCDSRYVENNKGEGSAIYISMGAEAVMSGGEISGCGQVVKTSAGTVFLHSNIATGSFTMNGGSITGNLADIGGGIYMNAGTVNLSGAAKITGNVKANNAPSNVYLAAGQTVTVPTALTSGADVGIYTATPPNSPIKIATGDGAAASAGFFKSDLDAAAGVRVGKAGMVPSENTAALYLAKDAATAKLLYVHATKATSGNDGTFEKPYQTLAAAYAQCTSVNNEIRVLSNLDVTAATTFDANRNVSVQSYKNETEVADAAFSVTRASNFAAPMLTVSAGNVTLNKITLDGNHVEVKTTTDQGGTFATSSIRVSGGALTMGTGSTLKNNHNTAENYNTSGVLLQGTTNAAKFTLAGGAITGNRGFDGAGVMLKKGDFTMTGGKVSKNIATGYCGGVYAFGDAASDLTANISGGEISENFVNSPSAGGAGIMLHENSKMALSGDAKVINNGVSVTAVDKAAGVWFYGDTATLTVSGNVQISGNTAAAKVTGFGDTMVLTHGSIASNVFLKTGKTVAIASGHMGTGANIGVYTQTAPTSGHPVTIATGATEADVPYFHSDIPTGAGVALSNTTLVLDWSKRTNVVTDVALDGTASITVTPTQMGAHYAVLDATGAVANPTVTGGTNASGTNWYTADNSGAMTFGGLDPAKGPYQVVTSTDSTTPPNGSSGATTNATVGDKVNFLYVKSDGADTNSGTKAAPLKTITKAFEKITAGTTGMMILLSDLTNPTSNPASNSAPTEGSTVIITSEGSTKTMSRDQTGTSSFITVVGKDSRLVLDNVIVNGNKGVSTASGFGELFVKNGSTAVLRNGAKIINSANRAVNIRGGGTFIMEGGEISGNTAGANDAYQGYTGTADAGGGVYVCGKGDTNAPTGGTFIMTGGTITGNKATAGAAGVFGETGTTFKMSGTPKVFGNTMGAEASNVYLKGGQTITLTGRMAEGAEVLVYVDPMPNAVGKTAVIATNAAATDAAYFHSDKMTQAGIVFDTDKVVLSYDARAQATGKVDKDGKGQMIVETQTGTKYQVTEKDNAAVPGGLTVTDQSGNPVNPVNGWYTTADGPLVFKPLELAKEYDVHSSTAQTPGAPTPGGGSTVKIPVVGENVYAKPDTAHTGKTTIVIDPADEDIQYAVLDDEGNQVYPTAPNWISGTGDKISVELPNLAPGESYQIVGVPKTDTTSKPTDKDNQGESVITPTGGLVKPSGDDITREDSTGGKDKIVINPTVAGQEYGVYDPTTGETTWQTATDENGLTFDNLDPDKDYEVVTRTPGVGADPGPAKEPSLPTEGVVVPAATPKPGEVTGSTDANGAGSIKVNPTDADTKYAVVDADGNVIAPIGSDNDGWLTGGGGELTFAPLAPGGDYQVVTVPKELGDTDPADGGNADGSLYPENMADAVGPTVKVPTVSEGQITGAIIKNPGQPDDGKASITISPVVTDPETKYAVVDPETGKLVDTNGDGVLDEKDWKTGTGSPASITFQPLEQGKDYEIVTCPGSVPTTGTTPLKGTGTVVTAPEDLSNKISGDKIEREHNDADPVTDTITVENPGTGFEIGVVDPATGAITWKPGTGAAGSDPSVAFPGLDPNKEYDVVVRPVGENGTVTMPIFPGSHVKKVGEVEAGGIVKDAAGNPVAGAPVKVTVATLDGGYKTITVKTDENGVYKIVADNVKLPNSYAIYVESVKGCETSTQNFGSVQPQTLADITTAAATTNIVGGVVNQNGKPIKDVTVVIRDKNTGAALNPQPTGGCLTTTPGGGYVVENMGNLPNGTYIMETTGTDAGGNPISGMTEVVVKDGKVDPNKDGGYKNTNLDVVPGGIVSGFVKPLAAGEKATVTITVPVYDGDTIIGTKNVTAQAVGESGYYQFAGVPDGNYSVSITTPKGTVSGEMTVAGGNVTAGTGAVTAGNNGANITVPATKPANNNVVSGIVMDKDGKPVKDAVVTIYDKDGNVVSPTKPATITTGKGGGWSVEGLDPAKGPYYASVDKDGTNGVAGPITVAADGKVSGKTNIELDGTVDTTDGTVTGTDGKLLTDKVMDGDKPAAGASVVVKDSNGNVIATTKTNSDGSFFVPNVPDGATVSVTMGDKTATGTVIANGATGTLKVTPALSVTAPGNNILTVVGPDGGVLPVISGTATGTDAKISVKDDKGENVVSGGASWTVTDGKLDVSKLPGGTYVVTVEQGGMKVDKEITVSNTAPGNTTGVITGDKTLTIPPHKVEGELNYAAGTIPSDATVNITGKNPGKDWGTSTVNPNTGKFEVPGVPEGEYTVTVTVKDPTDPSKDVEIETTLTVDKNGNASYASPWAPATGGTITNPDGTLDVLTKAPSTAVQTIITAIETANGSTGDDALDKVKDAMNKFDDLTDEEKKQVDKDKVEELSNKLETLLGNLSISSKAEGVKNTEAAKTALNNQRGLLVGNAAIGEAATKNVNVDLKLNAENVTDNPPADKYKVEAAAKGGEIGAYFDITITKTTTVKATADAPDDTAIITTEKLPSVPLSIPITLAIPAELQGHAYYNVIRVHNGEAKRIPLSGVTATEVTFSSNLYSTYAIVVSDTPIFGDEIAVTPSEPGTPGGGGSSSGSVTVKPSTGGTVTVSPIDPSKGDKVTITVTPDEGFTLDELIIKDKNGKPVEYVDNGDGTYTYTQPTGKVTVTATFKKVTGDPDSNGVSELLDTVNHNAYLKGRSAEQFAPAGDMTRGEVAQMFYNLLKNKDSNLGSKASFSDVAPNAWYTTAVNTLANIGILNGYSDGTYRPEQPIARAEFVAIATRFAAMTTGSKTYTDVAKSYWAYDAIGAASYYGWIDGYTDGTFKPTANIARSEAVRVVNAMLGRSADKKFIDSQDGLKTFPDMPKTDWAFYEIVEATTDHGYTKNNGVETWGK